MELRQLRYFMALADELHFGRAAKRVHIVQPALSMQIRALEEEIGAPLFVRSSRSVQLTQVGAVLRIEAARLLGQAERAGIAVSRAAAGLSGSVRIAFVGNAAFAGTISAHLAAFRVDRPDVEIHVHEMDPNQQAEAIANGTIDVGYTASVPPEFVNSIDAIRLGSWPWVVAMSKLLPLAEKANVSSDEMRDLPVVLYASGHSDEAQMHLWREILGTEPRVVQRVSNTLTVLALAAAGVGVALVPSPLRAVNLPNLAYGSVIDTDQQSDLLIIRRSAETSPSVLAYVSMARGAVSSS